MTKVKKSRPLVQDKAVYRLCIAHMSVPYGVSETIPDDTIGIKELLAKHVRGMEVAANEMRTPVYDSGADFDSQDLEAINRMDLAERYEYSQSVKADVEKRKAELDEINKKIEAEKEAAKEAAMKKKSRRTWDDESDDSDDDKTRGDARLGGNPPDDVPRRPKHAGQRSERSGRTEADTRGVTAGD